MVTKTIRDILKDKGSDICAIGPDDTVYDALELMAEKNIGALMVMEGGKPVGLFSERDYARRVILKGRSSKTTAVRDVMTSRLVNVGPDQTVQKCMALLTEKHFRHLPVVDGDNLVGLVSIGDLVKSIIDEQQFIIDQLEGYISG
ncbi:MAG: CBS domain-containing protein [Salinisphaera sp.]|nr:CBS domain-containing protein [Salinisphaera sp.]